MVGLLIFILSRHGENSHWRAVPQIASEARWLGNPCCVEGRATVSSSRRVSLPILPLWAGEHDWAHRESFLLQPWDQTQRVDRVWQGPKGASLRLRELSHFSAYHMASPGLALFSSQLWLKRPKSQYKSHRYETKAFHHPSLSFPGSRVTCSKTGAQCQIWLKAGPPGHGAGGFGIWKVGVWLGVGAKSTWSWWGVLFFPFVQLNLGSKLFHSFYLEGSPHLEKTWSQDFLLDGNST